MRKLLLLAAVSLLIPLTPAHAGGSRGYAGSADGALTVCPADETLPCEGGAIFTNPGAGNYVVQVVDDAGSVAGLPVPFDINGVHPAEDPVTGLPARVVVRACGIAAISLPDGYDLVVFLRAVRPGVNTTTGAVTPNKCVQESRPFTYPTTGNINFQ